MENAQQKPVVHNKFKNIKLSKLKFLSAALIDKLDNIDLHNYIDRLHSLLKKQGKKLRKYKEKANKKVRRSIFIEFRCGSRSVYYVNLFIAIHTG